MGANILTRIIKHYSTCLTIQLLIHSDEIEIMTFHNSYSQNFNCEENSTVQKNNLFNNILKFLK